jgi:hypothetical protein
VAWQSEQFMELSTQVTHTTKDRPETVDHDKLAAFAVALSQLLLDPAGRLS